MSKLWSTLKSVVGGGAVEEVATVAAKTASSSASGLTPALTSDGMLQGFAAIKPHQPLIKFRWGAAFTDFCILEVLSSSARV